MPIALPTYKPQLDFGATRVKITELSIPLINTKTSLALENTLRKIVIRNKDVCDTKINFDNGLPNFTIPKGTCFDLGDLYISGIILYVEADKVSTVEIIQLY